MALTHVLLALIHPVTQMSIYVLFFFPFEVGQCPQTRWQWHQTVCVSNPFAILKMMQRHHRALLPALQETQ